MEGFAEVEAMFSDVDLGNRVDGVEYVPLGISDKGYEGDGEAKFRAKLESITETEEIDKESNGIAGESDRVVSDAINDIEAKFESVPDTDDGIDHEGGRNDESDGSDSWLRFSDKGGDDEATKTQEVKDDGVAVGTSIVLFEVEFVEDERENSLHGDIDNRVEDKSMINGGIHAHEFDIRINTSKEPSEDDKRSDNTEQKSGHGSVAVAVADFADVGTYPEN